MPSRAEGRADRVDLIWFVVAVAAGLYTLWTRPVSAMTLCDYRGLSGSGAWAQSSACIELVSCSPPPKK